MKKSVFVASVIAIIGVSGAFLIGAMIKKEESSSLGNVIVPKKNTQEQQETKGSSVKDLKDKNSVDRVSVPTAGYKLVRVSDGMIAFSFEVPERWLVETRHSGEKQLSVDEMREFLATNYDGDIKKDPKLTSDYSDFDWNSLKSSSEKQVKAEFFRKDPENGYLLFPNASVAAGAQIWYTDTSWEQVDFFVRSGTIGSVVAGKKKKLVCSKEDSAADNVYLCGSDAPQWGKSSVGGMTADVLVYKTDVDEKGKEDITKGGTGGKEYYVPVSSEKTLLISKQAKGDAQYEKDFDHLIATLRFE